MERKQQYCFDENNEVILIILNVKNIRLTIGEPEMNINEILYKAFDAMYNTGFITYKTRDGIIKKI